MTDTRPRLRVGDRVRATADNIYLANGRITVGSGGTIVEVNEELVGHPRAHPYKVRYDRFAKAALWTKENEITREDYW